MSEDKPYHPDDPPPLSMPCPRCGGTFNGLSQTDCWCSDCGTIDSHGRIHSPTLFAEFIACCKAAINAYDSAHATGKSYWRGEDVDEMRATVAKAEGRKP